MTADQTSETTEIKKDDFWRSKQHIKRFGYSITMAKNMEKHGCNTVEEYRLIRKARKKKELEVQQAKHKRAKQGRIAKSTSVSSKKK